MPTLPPRKVQSLADYEQDVRDRMDLAGLPRNWQPGRAALQVCHARGLPVQQAAQAFVRALLPRYERWANDNDTSDRSKP